MSRFPCTLLASLFDRSLLRLIKLLAQVTDPHTAASQDQQAVSFS